MNLLRVVSVVSFLLVTGAAAAQPADDDLRVLDARAAELEAAGDWQGALEAHRQIFTRTGGKPPWNWASNHSNAAYRVGAHDEAARLLRIAMQGLPPTEPDYDGLKAKFEDRMTLLLTKVGRLQLAVTPEGAEILVDGASVGRAPLSEEVFVMPGTREIQVSLAGYQPETRHIQVAPGTTDDLSVNLTPTAPGPTSTAPNPVLTNEEHDSSPRFGLGIASLALGGSGAVMAVVLGAIAAGKASDVSAQQQQLETMDPSPNRCGAGTPYRTTCDELDAAVSDQLVFRAAAIGAGVGGAVLLAAGVSLLLIEDDDEQTAVSASLGPGSGALRVQGSF